MNSSLKKLLGIIDNYELEEKIDWVAPTKNGLDNSEPIIPNYYAKLIDKSFIFNINYYNIIKDDIRNYRNLNSYQMEFVKNLNDEKKNELFDIYNECMHSLNEVMNEK